MASQRYVADRVTSGEAPVDCIIIMGSGLGVVDAKWWDRRPNQSLVAINNAWSVRPDWDWMIHPEDFPKERRPQLVKPEQKIASADEYVPIQNRFGGFVYAGGTMAFTAAYWALGEFKPSVIAMIGCDMVYPKFGPTHFYGTGTADPLRPDVTLRSLEAKSARLWALAARSGCAMVNLSKATQSRLVYPRAKHADLGRTKPYSFDECAIRIALKAEADADYMIPSGRYWDAEDQFDCTVIDQIDDLWLKATHSAVSQ